MFSLLLIVLVALVIFSTVIPIFYLRYIAKMKKNKCVCSQGFNRNFIQYYSIYVYVSITALIILSFLMPKSEVNKVLETPTRLVMSTGLAFLIGYALYNYQKNVYQDSCVCAIESWEPQVMKVHSYIIGVLVLISILNICAMLGDKMYLKETFKNNITKSMKTF